MFVFLKLRLSAVIWAPGTPPLVHCALGAGPYSCLLCWPVHKACLVLVSAVPPPCAALFSVRAHATALPSLNGVSACARLRPSLVPSEAAPEEPGTWRSRTPPPAWRHLPHDVTTLCLGGVTARRELSAIIRVSPLIWESAFTTRQSAHWHILVSFHLGSTFCFSHFYFNYCNFKIYFPTSKSKQSLTPILFQIHSDYCICMFPGWTSE